MNVSLPPELARFVESQVESGVYSDAGEAIREGLKLLQRHDAMRTQWREQIERGWLQAEAGQLLDGPASIAEIKESLRRRATLRP